MTQARNTQTDGDASGMAEQRAKCAEQKVEELERTVAHLKAEKGIAVEPEGPDSGDPRLAEDAAIALRREPMMAHLMDALAEGKNIGHYGRLVFAMVAHHFLPPQEVLEWLDKDPDFGHDQAIALLRQVNSRDYNPPRRERILSWQAQQDFPIIPNVDDPDCGNVYRNLKFPDKVYEHIEEYQEEKAEAEAH